MNEEDTKYFSHYQPRLLSAEQLLDAICHVTDRPENFAGLPPGTRATQLPAPDLVKHDFLKIFGQPERQTVCACERSSESNLGMAIQFFNGPLIYNKLRDDGNRFRKLMKSEKSDNEIITMLHLAAVNRAPTEKELQASLQHIASKDGESAKKNMELEAKIAGVAKQVQDVRNPAYEKLLDAKLESVPEPLRADSKVAVQTEEGKRSEVQKYLIAKFGKNLVVSDEDVVKALDDATKKKLEALKKELAELPKQKLPPGSDRIMALEDICWAILNTNEFLFQH